MEKLGDLIKERRDSLKLSLRDFGKLCNMSHSYIRNLEDGDPRTGKEIVPTLSGLEKLAPVLGMSMEQLLKRIGYIHKAGEKFESSNLKLIRGNKTFKEISREITAKTGEKIDAALYEALEKGNEKIPSPILIDVIAKYVNVDSTFFYRKNSPELLEYAKANAPYNYEREKEKVALCVNEEIKEFITDSMNIEYVEFARQLKEKNISVEKAKKLIFGE